MELRLRAWVVDDIELIKSTSSSTVNTTKGLGLACHPR